MSFTSRCDAISAITGDSALGLELGAVGLGMPQTLRANSMIATCRPRQMPKNGSSFSRAQRIASIIPSMPRTPKPPGTSSPSYCREQLAGRLLVGELVAREPVDLDAGVVGDAAVDQRLLHRLVGVVQVGVLADHRDAHLVRRVGGSARPSRCHGREVGLLGLQPEPLADHAVEALLAEAERDLVDRLHVGALDHALEVHVAEERDLALDVRAESGCSLRQIRMSGWIPICIRSRTECCVGLVFSSPAAAMYGTSVRCMNSALSRPTSWRNWRIASRNGSDSMSPTVPPISVITTSCPGAVRRMAFLISSVMCGNDLHGGAEVLAAALLADDVLVDPAGGDVVLLGERAVDEALVVAEVEVGLGAVVGDVHLAVLERRHRARIDVDVRVELLHRDASARAPPAGARARRRRCPCRATRRRRR